MESSKDIDDMIYNIAVRISAIMSPLGERPDYGNSNAALPRGEAIVSYVRKTRDKDEWCVYSEKNPDWSGGCYPSKTKAKERLKQVEMFKRIKSKK